MNSTDRPKHTLKKGRKLTIKKCLTSANGKYQMRINENGGGFFMIRETQVAFFFLVSL